MFTLTILICLLALVTDVQGYYQSGCQSQGSQGAMVQQGPLSNSPGTACRKPIGYNVDPTQISNPSSHFITTLTTIASTSLTKSAGVTVTQGAGSAAVTGTLKVALTGATTKVIIETNAAFLTTLAVVIGGTTVIPASITAVETKSPQQLSTNAIGMRINVGASPNEIYYTAYPTNGITQSTAKIPALNIDSVNLQQNSYAGRTW